MRLPYRGDRTSQYVTGKDATFVAMNTDHTPDTLYTAELIEFATIGVEFASLLERGGELRATTRRLLELLPRLYAQMLRLPDYFYSSDEDYIEEYITQDAYDRVRHRLEQLFGSSDAYLSTSLPDMQYSDTPLAMTLSEALADVYQHVGNLLGILREQNEVALPAAIGRCYLYWREHWGGQLLSALPALHQLYLEQGGDEDDEAEADENEEHTDTDIDWFADDDQ